MFRSDRPAVQFVSFMVVFLVILLVLSIVFYQFKQLSFEIVGNIGSLFQGTLGVVVALAGSIVAINLANQAYIVARQTEQRETVELIVTEIQKAVEPIHKVFKELSILYELEKLIVGTVDKLKGSHFILYEVDFYKKVEELRSQKIDDNLRKQELDKIVYKYFDPKLEVFSTYKKYMETFVKHEEEVISYLELISLNPLSLSIWRSSNKFNWLPINLAIELRKSSYDYFINLEDPFKFRDMILNPILISPTVSLLANDLFKQNGVDILKSMINCFPSSQVINAAVKSLIQHDVSSNTKQRNFEDVASMVWNDPRIKSLCTVALQDLLGQELYDAINAITFQQSVPTVSAANSASQQAGRSSPKQN